MAYGLFGCDPYRRSTKPKKAFEEKQARDLGQREADLRAKVQMAGQAPPNMWD